MVLVLINSGKTKLLISGEDEAEAPSEIPRDRRSRH